MKNFKFNRVSDTEPMNTDPFYLWLNQFDKRSLPLMPLILYLSDIGYKPKEDYLKQEDLQFLRSILDHWLWQTPETQEVCHFDALFTFTENEFYIRGKDKRYGITQKLRELIMNSGWVYHCDMTTTYFEITEDNRLFAKYQSILGQRYLCKLKP